MVIHISWSCTAKIFPKRMWKRSVELLSDSNQDDPKARKEEKVIPIAVSLLMMELLLI